MFIQCIHCQATFKIDEQKIPDNNSFVKCSNCFKPILLPGKREIASAPSPKGRLVECDNCKSRYMIPPEKLTGDTQKVRCGKCSHVFKVISTKPSQKRDAEIANGQPDQKIEADEKYGRQESRIRDQSSNANDIGLDSISIPDENKLNIDSLFEDFEPEKANLSISDSLEDDLGVDKNEFSSKSPSNPTEEYLKSVDLKGDFDLNKLEDDELETISEERKQKFFLKPSRKKENKEQLKGIEDELTEHWPEIQDETETDVSKAERENDDLSETNTLDLPSENLFGRKKVLSEKNRKKPIAIALFVFLLLLLTIGGAVLLFKGRNPMATLRSLETSKYTKKVCILEPLKGKFVVNKASNKKIFVLQGKIKNHFPSDFKISSLKIKGTLYNNQNRVIAESVSFAGNNLSQSKLEAFDREKIRSFYNYQFGGNNRNLNLGFNQVIPFQVVFFDIAGKIAKLEAKIVHISQNVQK